MSDSKKSMQPSKSSLMCRAVACFTFLAVGLGLIALIAFFVGIISLNTIALIVFTFAYLAINLIIYCKGISSQIKNEIKFKWSDESNNSRSTGTSNLFKSAEIKRTEKPPKNSERLQAGATSVRREVPKGTPLFRNLSCLMRHFLLSQKIHQLMPVNLSHRKQQH